VAGTFFQVGEQDLETASAALHDLAQTRDVQAQRQTLVRPACVVEFAPAQGEQIAEQVGFFVEPGQRFHRASVLRILIHGLAEQFAREFLVDLHGQFAGPRAQGLRHVGGDGRRLASSK